MKDNIAQRLVKVLKDSGIDFLAYLPETRLSEMIPLLRADSCFKVVPTTSEAEAVSIAAGASLAGHQAAVYMEGTGVYVSAYSLFAVGERFGVPMLLLVSYVGSFSDKKNSSAFSTLRENIAAAHGAWNRTPDCKPGGTLGRSNWRRCPGNEFSQAPSGSSIYRRIYSMKRFDCLELLAPLIKDEIVVTSGSGQRVEWGHLSQHEGSLFVGSLGNALGVGLGLAIGLPKRKIIVLESDGSVVLSLFNLPTLANQNPANLVVIVFDNHVYSGSNISHPTVTAGKTDLEMTARGTGIDNAVTLRDAAAFKKEITSALREKGLRFIVAKIEESLDHRKMTRPNVDLLENKYRFVRYLERTEGKAIFPNERAEGKQIS